VSTQVQVGTFEPYDSEVEGGAEERRGAQVEPDSIAKAAALSVRGPQP